MILWSFSYGKMLASWSWPRDSNEVKLQMQIQVGNNVILKTSLYLWTCCLTSYNLYYKVLNFVQF